jgi:uncharacterized membrane protein
MKREHAYQGVRVHARRTNLQGGKIMRFSTGLIAGAGIGLAVGAAVLQKVRPDVTNKMVSDGRRALKHYKKMFN